MANIRDALLAVAIVLAVVVVWWLLAVAIDWLRDWLQALNIRKQLHTGKHVSPGGEPLPVLGGQQRPSWWRRVTGSDDEFEDENYRDGMNVIEAVEAANQDVPRPGLPQIGEAGEAAVAAQPGYFHDDVPTDVVPAVQLTDGTYVGLKGTIPADLSRPGSGAFEGQLTPAPPVTPAYPGPGQPHRWPMPGPHAGPPEWHQRETTWVDRLIQTVMAAPIDVVHAAIASPNAELHLWGWQQRKALEMAT
jgi:hypothetical protein